MLGDAKAGFGTPVAMFIFNRPDKARFALDRLRLIRPQTLFVVADGPRVSHPSDFELVQQAREVMKGVDWPCEVVQIFAEANLGLYERFNSALDFIFREVDRLVVLEDDCLPEPSFFYFAQDLLLRYEEDEKIGIISGWNFAPAKDSQDYFFDLNAYIWGWATWRTVWQRYRLSGIGEPRTALIDKSGKSKFSHPLEALFTNRLVRAYPLINTWDIPFSFFLRTEGFLNAVPTSNLIKNIGMDGSGTNDQDSSWEPSPQVTSISRELRHPDSPVWDKQRARRMWNSRMKEILLFAIKHPAKAAHLLRKRILS